MFCTRHCHSSDFGLCGPACHIPPLLDGTSHFIPNFDICKKQAESKVGKGDWKGRKREKRRSNKNEEDRERERRRLGEKKQENETGMKKGRAIQRARKRDQEQEQECEAKTIYEVIDRRIERELHIKREQQQEGEKTEKERNSEVS